MSRIILFLLLCIVLSACSGMLASTPTPEPVNTPTNSSSSDCEPATNWTIEYHRTGGFGGFDQSLTLKSDGNLSVRNKQPPLEKQMTVPRDQLDAIADLLNRACPFEAGPMPGVCADCYTYDLKIQMDGQTYSVQAIDTSLTEEIRPLTNMLDELLTGQ